MIELRLWGILGIQYFPIVLPHESFFGHETAEGVDWHEGYRKRDFHSICKVGNDMDME